MKMFRWLKLPKKKSPSDKEANINKPRATGGFGRRGSALPGFEDLPTRIEPKAYDIIYEHDTTYQPLLKRARRCGSFVPVVVGGGKRGQGLQRALDLSRGLNEMKEFLSYADVEGVRFAWLRSMPMNDMNVIDARGCGGRKLKAGGDYWWGGHDSNLGVRLAPPSNLREEEDEDMLVDMTRMMVVCPSAEVNPEGDTKFGLALLRVAKEAAVLDDAEYVYAQRHSLPKPVLEVLMTAFGEEHISHALNTAVGKLAGLSSMDAIAMDAEKVMKLLEANGKTWQFLTELRISLNGRAHKLVTGENLTSDSSGSGDSGSSSNAEKQFLSAAAYVMSSQSDAWTYTLLPFLEKVNESWLPARRKSDPPMYVEFRAPVEKQRLTVAEISQIADRNVPIRWDELYSTTGLTMPEGVDQEFGPYYLHSKMNPKGAPGGDEGGDLPSNTGESTQRSDREQEDSGIPADDTRKKDPREDLRNADKEEDDE